jgi:DNA-binding transcriptional LysR family regulator
MQLAWIEDFLALARLGSFTQAAEARGVAQSALSRRVRALEHWAGAVLFDRAAHPVRLTDAGRLLLPVAERAARDLAGVREQTRAVGSALTAAVVVAAPHSVAIGQLADLMRSADGAGAGPMPLLRVETDDAEGIARRLREGICHLGLLYAAAEPPPPDTGALAAMEVGRDRLVPVSAPGSTGVAPLYLLPGRPGTPTRWLSLGSGTYIGRAVAAARRSRFPPHHLRVVAENGLAAALRTLALEGAGLAWLPESLVIGDLIGGRLVRAGDEAWDVPLALRAVRSAAPSSAADCLFERLRAPSV